MVDFITREANTGDLEGILAVQRRAFGRVATAFNIPVDVLPPLTETVADLAELHAEGTRFFAASKHTAVIIGSVRGRLKDGVVEIERLVVDDGWQRQGVASALMDLLENSFHEASRFVLFTGTEATAPLALYAKRGYVSTREEQISGVSLVWLEKPGPAMQR